MATKDNPEGSAAKSERAQSFQFKASFEGKPDKSLSVMAYAFDRQGKLLASAPVKEGSAPLVLNPDQARTARIFFAPYEPHAKAEKQATLDTMDRLHAYEAVWKFDLKKSEYELLPIPEYYWKWWLWCSCRVRGQVVKPVTIAGVTTDLPICNARVHICEVDRIWWLIPRLPDPIIIRLRDELLKEIEFPRPIPRPDPPPFEIDPGVIDPSPENIAKMNRAALGSFDPARIALNPQPESRGIQRKMESWRTGSEVMLNPQPLPPKQRVSGLTQLDVETHSALMSASVPIVKQALQNNIALLYPYLCWWDWLWPYFCHCDEIDVLTTDAQGRFDTTIWYLCFGDHPDLYFWVEYCIGGVWTPVYHPYSICCYTYWDYVCGSDVTIRVTDPRVVPCGTPPPDLPGLQVAILSIGQQVSMSEIPVDSTDSMPLSGSATEGLVNGTNPFGGQLEPRVFFSRSALFMLGITHYRWSYRQLTAGDGITPVSDVWHAMDRQVIRHYAILDPATSTLSYPVYPLGPDPAFPGQNLFQIQPINAPTGRPEDWAPEVDSHEDSASAFFLSHLTRGGNAQLGAGKYELKFELFKPSAVPPGSIVPPVNLTTSSIALNVANVPAPFGSGTVTTVNADDHHRFKDGAGNTVAFRLVLHVDNNVCSSALNPISGAGLTVDADCGFIQYAPGSSAHISFIASHPHDFATFSLSTVRGLGINIPDADASGQVNVAVANGFVRSGAVFAKDVAVNTLLTVNTPAGHTPCTKAAFSEVLDVAAMATDGWQTLSYLDASRKQAAYALEPA